MDLNGWSYHDNWLHNLLIASSLQGRRPAEKLDNVRLALQKKDLQSASKLACIYRVTPVS